ncbi:MAG: OadG family protein [Bacteroidales bacterium]|nr:OadG family protein [Bacteroidales bacterium]
MTTFLFSALMTAGGDRMAQTDPHGWTLTLISVSVVFAALIILYVIYNFSGKVFSGAFKRTKRPGKKASAAPDEEIAAAIAAAIDMENGGDIYAAIAAAVHMYLNDTVHDHESLLITISHKDTPWETKSLNFRKLPR